MSDSAETRVLKALGRFLAPLEEAAASPQAMQAFLLRFGWRSDGAAAVVSEFTDLAGAIADLRQSIDADAGTAELLARLTVALTDLAALANAAAAPSATHPFDKPEFWQSLPEDVFAHLLFEGISREAPGLFGLFTFTGVFRSELVPADDAVDREAHVARRLDWAALGRAFSAPDRILPEVYGWGGAFDHSAFMEGLEALFAGLGAAAVLQRVGVDDLPPEIAPDNPAATDLSRLVAIPPLTPPGDLAALIKPLLLIIPAATPSNPSAAPSGISIAPTLIGSAGAEIGLPDADSPVRLSLAGDFQTAPVRIGLYPSGVEILDADSSIDLAATLSYDLPAPAIVLGTPGASRLEIGQASLGFGLSGAIAQPEMTLTAALPAATVYLGGGEGDGLFKTLLGDLSLEMPFSVAAAWSSTAGFTLTGGMPLTIIVPVDKTIAEVVQIDSVEIGIDLGQGDGALALSACVTGSATIGPLFAAVERAGLEVTITPRPLDDPGNLGSADLGVGFKPPTGYAVALDADPISGGGYVSVLDNEYRGALALNFSNIGFSAYAILTTEFPDGSEGYSFAASIFAEFSVPLAYGFFLTGLGGFIGINRSIDTDAMRGVLYDGRLDGLLFPSDPIASAPQILEDMAAILPPVPGRHVVGPCARISWGQPALIDITLGVIIELGDDIRLVILGGLSMILPDKNKVLVSLRVQFMGEIDFAAGTISFDATLEGSKVLNYAIDGDIAIRTGWGTGIEHIASFGGLHPQYPKPATLPDLARLSISFGGNNPRVTLSSYFALTQNSLQFGARADLYAKGPDIVFVGQVAAEGFVAFDALIYFNPFAFQVGLRGGLSLLVNGNVKAALFFSLELSGPNTYRISGEVWVKVLGVKVRFGITHTWGQRESLPTYTSNAADLLAEAIQGVRNFEPLSDGARDTAVAFRSGADVEDAIDPLGGLRLSQSTAPLAIRLERVGEANITGPRVLDLAIRLDGVDVATTPVNGQFVRGHFFAISKQDRLRTPVLESHKSGVDIGAAALSGGGEAVEETYSYEVIVIGMHGDETGWSLRPMATVLSGVRAEAFARSGRLTRLMPASGLSATLRPAETVHIVDTRYTAPGAANAPAATLSEVQQARPAGTATCVADYIGDAA